jgi:hypothetical protein
MTPILLIILLALALAAAGVILARVFFFTGPKGPPLSARPEELPLLDCNSSVVTSSFPAGAFDADRDINAGTGGTFTGRVVRLTAPLNPTSDLIIVAKNDLTIAADIMVGAGTFNINMISLEGKVLVARGTTVTAGSRDKADRVEVTGDPARNPPATALAKAGGNGGQIQISGVNVEIAGVVVAGSGGEGGSAMATGRGSQLGQVPDPQNPGQTMTVDVPNRGGPPATATAVGGSGGYGGRIIVCARDSIGVRTDAQLIGGSGGDGGSAEAIADNGAPAYARGGDGSRGGGVLMTSILGGQCQIFLEAGSRLRGGNSSFAHGGDAQALGGKAYEDAPRSRRRGGDAIALAGKGGDGEGVSLLNCVVFNSGGILQSGDGRDGGMAMAMGGRGADSKVRGVAGDPGGDAEAGGGSGGKRGESPPSQTPNDPPVDLVAAIRRMKKRACQARVQRRAVAVVTELPPIVC